MNSVNNNHPSIVIAPREIESPMLSSIKASAKASIEAAIQTPMLTRSQVVRFALGGALAVAARAAMPAVALSSSAPDFTLRTMGGPNMRLQEQRGRVVMINFWATWCGPCRQEMPQLSKLYDKYRASGFVLMGVNVDDDTRNAVEVAGKLGVTFPVLLDTDKTVSKLYDLSTMPSTVLIDRDGKVRYFHRGYLNGYEETYEKQIRELLK